MTTIPIFSDSLSQEELKNAINKISEEKISLTVIENPDKFRSALSDPTVLAAIIQAGTAVLTTLITVLVTIYVTRKSDNKTGEGGTIIINLKSGEEDDDSKVVLDLDDFKSEELKDKISKLELHPELIEDISYIEET